MTYLAQQLAGMTPYWQGYLDGAMTTVLGLLVLAFTLAALGAKKKGGQ